MRSDSERRLVHLDDHVTEVGQAGRHDGEPVVLIHAALLDRHMWDAVAHHLTANLTASSAGIRLLTYDVRGHGFASAAPPITGIRQLAADLETMLTRWGMPSAHLCGLSLGGAIAQEFAALHPWRVRSLILAATDRRFPRDTLLARAEVWRSAGPAAALTTTLARWFSPAELADDGPGVRYARDQILATSETTWSAVWLALAAFDVTASAQGLDCPVLAVSGAQDTTTPPDRLHALAQAYPRAHHVVLDPGPHMLALATPASLARHIAAFTTGRRDRPG